MTRDKDRSHPMMIVHIVLRICWFVSYITENMHISAINMSYIPTKVE